MNKIKLKLFYVMIFLVFTQGMWERIFLFSSGIQVVLEVSILSFILFQFKYNSKAPGSSIFLSFLLASFFIGFYNGDSIIETFLYIRYLVYMYLIYNQLYSSAISNLNRTKLFKFLSVMILIQGIGAVYNIFILNDRVEGYVGLMSSLGGTTATVFPLL